MKKTKKALAMLMAAAMAATVFTGCGKEEEQKGSQESASSKEEGDSSGKKELSMWFWGASDYQREAMDKYLIQAFNESQNEYELTVEYRASVDNDIAVALSGGEGPDIVYGSGPAFVAGYAAEGLFLNLDKYSEQYGWKDRVLDPCYEICTIDGSLYSIPGALTSTGVFYNKKVLEDNGWEVPTTYEQLVDIMEQAKEKGLYAGLTGAKDWRYTNEMYVGMMLTHVAGPEVMYKVLTGEQKWNSPEVAEAMNVLVDWYKNGYLAGEDYWNFDFNEAAMMLANEQSPFFYGALNVFQFIKNIATEEQCDNIGFFPLPNYDGSTDHRASLGSICSFSINSQCKNPDGAAMVLDYMLTSDFSAGMSSQWPGYWGMPLKDLTQIDLEQYQGIYKEYMRTCTDIVKSLDEGDFAYGAATCFPASTYEACIDIDTVWFGEATVEEYLDNMDKAFAEDVEKKSVATIPKPAF
ncbi:ABC transporter substrate-binding protein [Lactonifactor longoviformis]|uniref:ABC transporter substrate-binding protein n=1 Tax=Lactonifactor longoviformis TaxID=341220 RepID=UPI001D008D22|nr:extracellular solute-binding protein [Lactonifactor longoviformis]MCB5711421.1 extracellular solute-binding protein [Lactonifactor longoviformis]MCB5715388.1 extracellular solute-binding protein [Lactonifactor longoviformis]